LNYLEWKEVSEVKKGTKKGGKKGGCK
jgi:hypothetical protein